MCRRQKLKLQATDYFILIALFFLCNELVPITIMDALEIKAEKQKRFRTPLQKMIPILVISEEDWALYRKVFAPTHNSQLLPQRNEWGG